VRHISLAIVTLLLATSASAEECLAETHSYEGKVYTSETCTARVDDVIKANADGFVQIDYIVEYRGERLVVEDTLARTNHAVGEQISFWVSKLGMPPDSWSQGFRILSAQVIVPKPEAKPAEEDCSPSPTTSPGTTTQ
jgi:hypothetical protein